MNITFKAIGKRERETLEEVFGVRVQHTTDGRIAGGVVAIGGCIVLAFGRNDQVIYQDGSDAIPDLVRAYKRVASALSTYTYDDYERVKRKGKPPRTVADILAG